MPTELSHLKSWNDRPVKKLARYESIRTHGRVYQHALMMPGDPERGGCTDITQMLDEGSLTRHSRMFAIERDRAVAARLKVWLHQRFLQSYVFEGELADFYMEIVGFFFDYVNLDTCSSLTPEICQSLGRLSGYITPDSRLCLTFSRRRNGLEWANYVWQHMGGKRLGDGRAPHQDGDHLILNQGVVPTAGVMDQMHLDRALLSGLFCRNFHVQTYREWDSTMWMHVYQSSAGQVLSFESKIYPIALAMGYRSIGKEDELYDPIGVV